jgi:hypothetical protein
VDGFQALQSTKIRLKIDTARYAEAKLMGGYAINRKSFFGKGQLVIDYAPLRRSQWVIKGGWLADDFNPQGSPFLLNGIYNLLTKENYIRFYDNKYIESYNNIEITHGFESLVRLKWQKTDTLSNITNYSVLYPNKKYSLNLPINSEMDSLNLYPSELLHFNIALTYRFKQYFTISRNRKHYEHTNYPYLTFDYKTGLKVKSNHAAYHQVELKLAQDIDFYSVSRLKYTVLAGTFLSHNLMHFSSFRHFNTIEEPFTSKDLNEGFMLLPGYEYSTLKTYFEGHLKYSTQFLLLKRISWISNQMWEENLYYNTLWVDKHKWYNEIGYSLSGILVGGNIGIFGGFTASSFKNVGIKISYRLN